MLEQRVKMLESLLEEVRNRLCRRIQILAHTGDINFRVVRKG
jgi:hypothetical protein